MRWILNFSEYKMNQKGVHVYYDFVATYWATPCEIYTANSAEIKLSRWAWAEVEECLSGGRLVTKDTLPMAVVWNHKMHIFILAN